MSETGQWDPTSFATEYQMLRFVFGQLASRMATCTLVQVVACTNDGAAAAIGTVDVQPLINQMTGARKAAPHGVLYKLPYMRIQGGRNAVIIDPEAGDIGLACFALSDISSVKATLAQANPGSARQFDWADGLYLFTVLSASVPQNYFQANDNGINVLSASAMGLQAGGAMTLTAATSMTLQVGSNTMVINETGVIINGRTFLLHEHTPGSFIADGNAVTGDSGGVV